MTVTSPASPENVKARPNEIRALADFRQVRRVTLIRISQRFGKGTGWLSEAFAGYKSLSRADVRRLRKIIEELSGADK